MLQARFGIESLEDHLEDFARLQSHPQAVDLAINGFCPERVSVHLGDPYRALEVGGESCLKHLFWS